MNLRSPGLIVCLIMGLMGPGAVHATQVSRQVDAMGREYYLFIPDKLDPDMTYWLVVEVHGYGGRGSEGSGVRRWVERGDCIGVAPSFPNDGYQMLGKDSGLQLTQIFEKLRKDYKLHDRLFIYGHSGGAQYAHRFTLKYPQLVVGCCATSAGTWSTGRNFGTLNALATNVPVAISCGEKDTATTVPGMPMTRIVWAKAFEQELAKRQFFYKASYWPGAGHEGNPQGNAELADEAFALGTSGMVGEDRENFVRKVEVLEGLTQNGDLAEAMNRGGALLQRMKTRDDKQTAANLAAHQWTASPAATSLCTRTAQGFIADQMNRLSIEIQKAALNQIAMIEKQAAPDAVTRLQSFCGTFAGWTKVRTAASQAALRLQARVR